MVTLSHLFFHYDFTLLYILINEEQHVLYFFILNLMMKRGYAVKHLLTRILRRTDKIEKVRRLITIMRIPDITTDQVLLNVYGTRRNVDERFSKMVMESVCRTLDAILIPELSLHVSERDLDSFFRIANITNKMLEDAIDNIGSGVVAGVSEVMKETSDNQPEHISSIIRRIMDNFEVEVNDDSGTFLQ